MKSDKRKKMFNQKSAAKANRMKNPGFKSLYSRKKAYLHAHGGMGIDYPDQPWK